MKNTYERSVDFQYWVVTRKGLETLYGLMKGRIEKLGLGISEHVKVEFVSGDGFEYEDMAELMGDIGHVASVQDKVSLLRIFLRASPHTRCEMSLFFEIRQTSSCVVILSGHDNDRSCAEWVEETTMLLETFRDAVVPEGEVGEDMKESGEEFVMFDLEEPVREIA